MTAKQSGRADAKSSGPVAAVPNELAALQALGLSQLARFGAALTRAYGDMGTEIASFLADRIKEDVKTQHEILHCTDLAELQRVQARFIETAFEQYTAESGKLVSMSQERLISVLDGSTDPKAGN